MEKPVPTTENIHPLIKSRWSPRSFTSEPIPADSLKRIFEAARWSPSSYNEQPWRFILGLKGDSTYQMIFETLVEFNQKWAGLAPVLILAVGEELTAKGKINEVFKYDLGQSVAYMTLQAQSEGLFVHQMGGLNRELAAQKFKIPSPFKVVTVLAIGYKGESDLLDADLQKAERNARQRKALEELVFSGEFGKSIAL